MTRRRALLGSGLWLAAASGRAGAAESTLELNDAGQAALEALPGIGPALSERLLAERAQRPFADWADLQRRVPGLGPALAARLSAAGLRIGGRALDAPRP